MFMFDMERIKQAIQEFKPLLLPFVVGFAGAVIYRLATRTIGGF